MTVRIIETQEDLKLLYAFMRNKKLPITVNIKDGRDRSYRQNHTQFLWANEFAAAMGDRTGEEVRHDWKLRHGVPILRAEDDAFRATYDANLKSLPFAAKLALMAYIPVTSLMTVKQMTAYLDAVQREAASQGVRLTDPEAA